MKATIPFGKIDYNNSGRKNCLVEVELELNGTKENPVFTCSGTIWNARHTDCYCAGQCLDTIAEYIHTPLFGIVYRLWKLHHLNDMHPGTPAQEEALETFRKENPGHSFDVLCGYLKSVGLYEDNGYRYGSAWLYREIPVEDLATIKTLIEIFSTDEEFFRELNEEQHIQ